MNKTPEEWAKSAKHSLSIPSLEDIAEVVRLAVAEQRTVYVVLFAALSDVLVYANKEDATARIEEAGAEREGPCRLVEVVVK